MVQNTLQLQDASADMIHDVRVMDGLDLNPGDLSEWLDPQYDPSTIIHEIPLTNMELGDCSFDDDIYKDCKEIEDEPVQDSSRQYSSRQYSSRRRSSRSPPRRRARKLSADRSFRSVFHTPPASPVTCSSTDDELYNAALNKLASSMRRSEMSRVQVLRHRDSLSVAPRRESLSCAPRQPAPCTLNSLSDLLSGKRTALTAGLEQSRSQLRMYMSIINTTQAF